MAGLLVRKVCRREGERRPAERILTNMPRRFQTITLTIAALAVSSLPAQKRSVTAEDYFAFKNVTDARLSPDGKLVAYVVTSVDAGRKRRESQIWMTPRDGSR